VFIGKLRHTDRFLINKNIELNSQRITKLSIPYLKIKNETHCNDIVRSNVEDMVQQCANNTRQSTGWTQSRTGQVLILR